MKTQAIAFIGLLAMFSACPLVSAAERTIVIPKGSASLDWRPIYKQYSCDEDDILVFKREPSKNPNDQWVQLGIADRGYLFDISNPEEHFVFRMKAERPGPDKIEIIYVGGVMPCGPKIYMTINVRPLDGPAAVKKAEETQKFKKQIADLASVGVKDPNFDRNVLDLFQMHEYERSRLRRDQIAEGFNGMGAKLEERLENGDEDWRIVAVCGIGHCTNTLPKLREMLKQQSKVSGDILDAIAEMNTKESIPLIAPYLHDKDDHLADHARDAMKKLTESDFEKVDDKFPSWDDWWKAKGASYLGASAADASSSKIPSGQQ